MAGALGAESRRGEETKRAQALRLRLGNGGWQPQSSAEQARRRRRVQGACARRRLPISIRIPRGGKGGGRNGEAPASAQLGPGCQSESTKEHTRESQLGGAAPGRSCSVAVARQSDSSSKSSTAGQK